MRHTIGVSPTLAYRRRGAAFLFRARALSLPVPTGRPRNGTTRSPARPRDLAKARASALKNARTWFTTAARYALLSKVPKPVAAVLDSARMPIRGG